MRIKILFSLALSAMLVVGSGCVNHPDGHSSVGAPITKDTIRSKYEKPVTAVVNSTREVLQRNGKLLVDNVVDHTFQAKVNQKTVWVKVKDLDGKITEVDVQARGAIEGDIELAAELSKQIGMLLVVPATP
jgi:hypothetical protein